MADITKLRVAPAYVSFDGSDIGLLSYDQPVEIDDTDKEVIMRAGIYGDTAIDAVNNGHECTVMVTVVEVTAAKLAMAIPSSTLVGSTVTVTSKVGQRMRSAAKALIITRILDGVPSTDPDDIFTFPLASPAPGSIKQTFSPSKQAEFTIKFRVWQDLTTGEFYHTG